MEAVCGVNMAMGCNAAENGRASVTTGCESVSGASAAEANAVCKVRAGVGCTLTDSGAGSDDAGMGPTWKDDPMGESSNKRPWDLVVGVDAGDGCLICSTGLGACCGDMVVSEKC